MRIDEMPAGREMDALVWLALEGRPIDDILTCRFVDGDIQPHAGYPVGHISPPHYSTDDALALTLLEQDRQQGRSWHISISTTYQVSNYDNDSVPLEGWNWDNPEAFGIADTLPLAICRAVLKAKMQGEGL